MIDAFDSAPELAQRPARAAGPHSLSLDGRGVAQGILTAWPTFRLYALMESDARRILREVIAAVTGWDDEAQRAGIARPSAGSSLRPSAS